MRKNENYSIQKLLNGYSVSFSYEELEDKKTDTTSYSRWSYRDEGYIFKTLDEVIEWLKNKENDNVPY